MADQIGIKVNVVPTVNANDLQAAIDTSSKGGQVSLKNLNISSVVLNPSATKTLQTSIQAKIDAGKYSIKSVKLAKIDASAALDALKIDLQKLIGNMGTGGTGGSGNGGGGRKGPAMATDKNINAMTSAIGRFEKQYSNYLNLPQNASLKQNFAFIKQEAEAMSRSIGNIPLSDLRALGSMFDELRKGVTNTASGKTGLSCPRILSPDKSMLGLLMPTGIL